MSRGRASLRNAEDRPLPWFLSQRDLYASATLQPLCRGETLHHAQGLLYRATVRCVHSHRGDETAYRHQSYRPPHSPYLSRARRCAQTARHETLARTSRQSLWLRLTHDAGRKLRETREKIGRVRPHVSSAP